ncbi:MAG: hypothetical protein ACJ8AD_17865 [Gemmatimonadaceae bacterium]
MLPRHLVHIAAVVVAVSSAHAQHAGHEDMPAKPADSARMVHVMGQGVPLVTRADPTAGAAALTEAALTQTVVMAHATWWRGRASLDATFDAEGLTTRRGELSTGAFGEGFVDRRHPHTYLHELVLTGFARAGNLALSASAGRGFAPFGTDDPMVRPFAKYPVNHHLSQILERGLLIGAARLGPAILEAGTFGGEEPTSPGSLPRASRFGDSWAARATILPASWAEVQGSYARVASPENPDGYGLDQRKRSVSARAISPDGARYALAEWARTVEHDHNSGLDAFGYESALLEGALRAGPVGVAVRLEQTERAEEERLSDPFRTARPASDLSILGITRWRIATVHLDAPAVTRRTVAAVPFMELSRLTAAPRGAPTLFDPERFYGTSRLLMLSAGLRLRVGAPHARMGRYGVAAVEGPVIGGAASGRSSHSH